MTGNEMQLEDMARDALVEQRPVVLSARVDLDLDAIEARMAPDVRTSSSLLDDNEALVAEVRRLREETEKWRDRMTEDSWVRFYFDDADPVAECACGWHTHGDSASDAFGAWWKHRREHDDAAVAEAARVREALQAAREFVGWLTAMGQPTHEALETRRVVTLSDTISRARAALRALDAALDGAE